MERQVYSRVSPGGNKGISQRRENFTKWKEVLRIVVDGNIKFKQMKNRGRDVLFEGFPFLK